MAFGQRHARFNLEIISIWLDPADDDGKITRTHELGARMKPYTTGRAYLNLIYSASTRTSSPAGR